MSAPPKSRGEPVTAKSQLIEWIAEGSKPKADWRIGTEHEKFGFRRAVPGLPAPAYEDRGIRAVLEGLRDQFVWSEVREAVPGMKWVFDTGNPVFIDDRDPFAHGFVVK